MAQQQDLSKVVPPTPAISIGSKKRNLFRIPKDKSAEPKALSIFTEEDCHAATPAPVLQNEASKLGNPAKAAADSAAAVAVAKAEPPLKVRKLDAAPQEAASSLAKPASNGTFGALPRSAPAASAQTSLPTPQQASPAALTITPAAPVSTVVLPVATSPSPAAKASHLIFQGMQIAFTGEMEQMPRQDADDKVKMHGGKVMGAVSGNTTHLVLGSRLEDGRPVEETSKYRKYVDLKSKGKKWPTLLTEAEFIAMIPGGATAPAPSSFMATRAAGSTSCLTPEVAKATPGAVTGARTSVKELSNWVDTHAPRSMGDLIGNQSVMRKLAEWLRDWDSVVLKGQAKKVAFKPGGGMPENINARAVLLSGPPGIGKTTSARLTAQLHGGYEILEYNASDARGQKIIQEMANGIADNTTLNFGGMMQKKTTGLTSRAILIMDEVDGMGAGDRGGNAALIKMIKKTKNPIICICNDAHSQKIRSLAFSCYDLKFTRPPKQVIAQRCAQIAQREGLQIEPNALESLAESCGGDMRMVLNQLQMLSMSPMYKTTGIKYMDMKDKMKEMEKDQVVMVTPFDACKKLLNSSEGSRMSFRERMDMFFTDHSLVGMLVQENYLNAVKSKPVNQEVLNRAAFSADLFTVGDMMSNKIRMNQDWSLLPDMAVAGCVFPAQVTNGFIAFPSFPQFLGKYSTMGRTRRLTTELQAHLQLTSSVKGRALLTSGYGDLLYARMMRPLMNGDADGIQKTMAVLDAYGLRKEHLTEHLTDLRSHLGQDDLFKVVEPKIKSALTREFNSGAHGVKVAIPTKKRKAIAEADGNPDDMGDDDEKDVAPVEDKSDEEEDAGGSSFIKVKGKAKAKGKAASKPRAKAKGFQIPKA